MATLSSSLPTKSILGFQRSNIRAEIPAITVFRFPAKISSTHLSFRFGNVVSSQVRQRLPILFASPSERDIVKEKAEGSETAVGQGPPFLTILAGFVVLLLVCWIIGSIVMWLIGLIVNVPPSK